MHTNRENADNVRVITMSKETIELKRAFTVRSFIVSLIYLLATIMLTTLTWMYTQKGEVVATFLLPLIYPALLNAMFGKINPKLRLSAAELSLIVVAFLFTSGGISYLNDAFPDLIDKTMIAVGAGLREATMAPYFQKWVPDYVFPKDEAILTALGSGLKPGQYINLGLFAGAIAYWSAYSLLMFLTLFFLFFGLFGKQWVEVENLPFPEFATTVYVALASEDFEEGTTKSRWLSIKTPQYKVFWICFFIGVVLSFWPLLSQFFPVLVATAGTQEWGYPDFSMPALAAVFPGAWSHVSVSWEQISLWMVFVPTSALATMVIMYVIIGFIYPVAGVHLGILPYQPGVEYRWSWEDTPGNWLPFPYEVVWVGCYLAVGVVALWSVRGRFKELWSALTTKDVIEQGLSVKSVALLGIISVVGMMVFQIASGVPPLSAILMVISSIVFMTAVGKLFGLFWHHAGDFIGWGGQAVWWTPGVSLGYYPSTPGLENMNYGGFMTGTLQTPYGNCWFVRCHGIGSTWIAGLYKYCRDTKANLRDVLIGAIVLLAIGVPFAYAFYTWTLLHGGGIEHTKTWGSWVHWWKYGIGVIDNSEGITGQSQYGTALPWYGLGFVIFLVVYALRMKLAWFFIDPFAMTFSLPYLEFIWMPALVALIFKVVAVRAMGVTRWRNYGYSIATGLSWGWMSMMLIAWLIHFTSVIYPSFQSYFVP